MESARTSHGVAMTARGIRGQADLAAEAERLGYDSVFVSEVNGYDAVTTMSAIAAATRQVKIGTGIIGIYLRDPLLMAMTANSLNEYSNGRIILGYGTSTPVIVEKWHGVPWGSPLRHMREYVELVRRLLAGERVKHSGAYELSGAQIGGQSYGSVPVYLAALNPKMLELVGEVADGVILNFPTLSYTRGALKSIAAGVERAGRSIGDVTVAAFLRTTVTDRPEQMVPRYRAELLTYVLAPVYRRVFTEDGYGDVCDQVNSLWAEGKRDAALAAIPDAMVHDRSIIGSAEECVRRFQEYRDIGVDNAVVFPIKEGDAPGSESQVNTMRVLAPTARSAAGAPRPSPVS